MDRSNKLAEFAEWGVMSGGRDLLLLLLLFSRAPRDLTSVVV